MQNTSPIFNVTDYPDCFFTSSYNAQNLNNETNVNNINQAVGEVETSNLQLVENMNSVNDIMESIVVKIVETADSFRIAGGEYGGGEGCHDQNDDRQHHQRLAKIVSHKNYSLKRY